MQQRIICILLCCVSVIGCQDKHKPTQFLGYVEANWVYISSPQAGWIKAAFQQEGARVKVDELLFELDKTEQLARLQQADYLLLQQQALAQNLHVGARPAKIKALQAQLSQAKARLKQAQQERVRILPLVKNGSVAQSQQDNIDSAYAVAKAQVVAAKEAIKLAQQGGRKQAQAAAHSAASAQQAAKRLAQWQLQERSIKAPINAQVVKRLHYVGEFVNRGTPLLALLPDDGLEVHFFVPQAQLPKLKLGQQVHIKADGLKQAITAKVHFIAPKAEFTPPFIFSKHVREHLVFKVKAQLSKNSPLTAGLPVDVSL